MPYFAVVSPVRSTVASQGTVKKPAFPEGRMRAGCRGMERRCEDLLEPQWQGIHDLLTRLLGRCTCEAGDAHVIELYRPAAARVAEAS